VAGGVLARALGTNAELLASTEPFVDGEPPFSARFDNTDVYRLLYATLFGKRLPSAIGKTAPTRK
jgi:alkaline phosphatase